jgi:hypothetical protein
MNEPVSMKENKDQRDLTTGGGNPFSGSRSEMKNTS